MHARFLHAALVGALCAISFLAACSSRQGTSSEQSAASKIAVVASTNVYGSVAEAVGGDLVAVTSIIDGPSADPHSYEATPADAAAVRDAKIVIANGGGYDDFVGKLVASAGSNPKLVDVVELSGLRPAGEGEFNEHVWYSLPTVRKLATQLGTDLGAADPANAATYTANAAAFTGRLDAVQATVDAIKSKHAGQPVAVTEPVPGYLIEAAGLTDSTPAEFAEAVEEDTDPPAAVLNDTLSLFTAAEKVRALLANAQTETAATRQVEQAATAAAVPIVRVTETLPAGVTDYIAWMQQQLDALSGVLDRP